MSTEKPFPQAVQELLDEQEMSQRELIRKTRKHGWGSTGTISFLMRGEQPPTVTSMKAIARALGVPAEHFAEYRLAMARRSLNPKQVGLRKALETLSALNGAGPR